MIYRACICEEAVKDDLESAGRRNEEERRVD
jgi:hypothetical protein